ncbi:MAG: addiction module protein [Verrucomicrobia bacterium]|nr:addiction module protein [Verrucomicrobiota bacterium]
MLITVDTVAAEAMQLPEDQRMTLAHRLIASVEPHPDPAVEAAWDHEIRERIRRYDGGKSTTIAASQVFKELDQRIAR